MSLKMRKLYDVSQKELKQIAKAMEKESKLFTDNFREIPLSEKSYIPIFNRNGIEQKLIKSYRNNRFLVQLYIEGNWIRLSINRAKIDVNKNTWADGISWDDLMKIKHQLGFGDKDAIEIYPKDSDVVNVTNMRHLFICSEDQTPSCIWRK